MSACSIYWDRAGRAYYFLSCICPARKTRTQGNGGIRGKGFNLLVAWECRLLRLKASSLWPLLFQNLISSCSRASHCPIPGPPKLDTHTETSCPHCKIIEAPAGTVGTYSCRPVLQFQSTCVCYSQPNLISTFQQAHKFIRSKA